MRYSVHTDNRRVEPVEAGLRQDEAVNKANELLRDGHPVVIVRDNSGKLYVRLDVNE
jgi:hypothetical protein